MIKNLLACLLVCMFVTAAYAQDYNQLTDTGDYTQAGTRETSSKDSLSKGHKEIPKGLKVWTVDERFGERTVARPDTMQHMFQNSIFTSGLRGEYSTTGNLGAPRISRIFIDTQLPEQFVFTQPYDFFITPVDKFLFTNTLSPITNLTYNECGDRTNGEDHFKALFGVNAGKRIGAGFKFDYVYGRGYYQNQSTAHFNYSMYASYLGDRYQAHLLLSTNHQKVTENGGITDDRYITHPEAFDDNYRENEIPTVLEQNWNRNDNQHIFLTHRYSLGFNRKVRMTEEEIAARKFAIASQKEQEAQKAKDEARKTARREGRDFDEDNYKEQNVYSGRPDDAVVAGDEPEGGYADDSTRVKLDKAAADSLVMAGKQQETAVDTSWLKNEYVPVTSFIHTMKFDNYRRIYQAYQTPADFYADTYPVNEKLTGDSIFDRTQHYELKNTFAIALLEGFNKWAKAGLKGFVTSDMRHFTLPDSLGGTSTYNEHNLSVGGQLVKTEGKMLHYNATLETWLVGEDAGQLKIDASADLNFRLFRDTVTLAARGFFYRLNPTFYFRHYHSKHYWWDNTGLDKEIRSRVEGLFSLRRTRTSLRVAIDNISNYTYLAQSYTVTDSYDRTGNKVEIKQYAGNVNMLTAQLSQDFTFGPLNWETQITYQKSSNKDIIPVPDFNIYTNLYLKFKIARVLSVDLGADLRYFTKYNALDYSPALGQFTVQDNGANNMEVGGYPFVNVYANMHLKHTRFFIMMSHVNASSGDYFLAPHYPANGRILRFGVSWNFFN